MKNVLIDIWHALSTPDAYRRFITYKKGRIFLYVLLMTLITTVSNYAELAGSLISSGGISGVIEEMLPAFSVSAEKGLWVAEPMVMDTYNTFMEIDPGKTYEDITDPDGINGPYGYIMIADSEKLYVKSEGVGEQTIYYKDLGEMSLSKDSILAMVPLFYAGVFGVVFFMFWIDVLYYFIVAYMIASFAHVMSRIMKIQITFGKMMIMSIYAKTAVVLLEVVMNILGIYFSQFFIFSAAICMGYLYLILKDYREYEQLHQQ